MNSTEKLCCMCKISKPLAEFCKDRHEKDGFRDRCTPCASSQRMEVYRRNPHKDRARARMWGAKNKEAKKIYNRKHYQANKERLVAKAKEYIEKNKAAAAAYNLEWQRRNKEKMAATRKRRRARVIGATICDFTDAQWADMQEIYDHRCAYCGNRFVGRLEQEHVVPLSKGGDHTLTNIVPACSRCNRVKGTRLITPQYRKEFPALEDVHSTAHRTFPFLRPLPTSGDTAPDVEHIQR